MKNASRNGIVLRCAVALLPFVALFLLTNAFFQNVYLLEWQARHWYCGLWIVTGVIAIFDFKLSSFISYSNVIAIGLGQILGDTIQKYNISSITPDMNAEQRARLYLHPGFHIWICALLLFAAVFLAVKRYRKKPQHRQLRTIRSLS